MKTNVTQLKDIKTDTIKNALEGIYSRLEKWLIRELEEKVVEINQDELKKSFN